MLIVKYLVLLAIFIVCTYMGILYSKKYSNRVLDLKEMKNALSMFESKIRFTYEPIPVVFKDISNNINSNIGRIFFNASEYMENEIAGVAWEKSVDEHKNNTSYTKADIDMIKDLSKMLGNTDLEGQVSSIKLISKFLDNQIDEAQVEKNKNVKLYKTLGAGIGLAITIILV